MDSSSGAGGSGSGSKKSSDSSSKKGGKGSKQSKRKAPDELWNDGNPPEHLNPVDNYLVDIPPKAWTNTDPSVDVLCLLRYVEQALRLAVRCLTIQMLLAYVLN